MNLETQLLPFLKDVFYLVPLFWEIFVSILSSPITTNILLFLILMSFSSLIRR